MKLLERFWNWVCGTNHMIQDFEKDFPDKCIICSYQRYGYANGMTDDPNPPPHANCPERDPWSEPQITDKTKKL